MKKYLSADSVVKTKAVPIGEGKRKIVKVDKRSPWQVARDAQEPTEFFVIREGRIMFKHADGVYAECNRACAVCGGEHIA